MTAEARKHELKVLSPKKRCLKGSVIEVNSKAGAEKCPMTDICALGVRDACERVRSKHSHSVCVGQTKQVKVWYYCGMNREGKR